MSSVNRDTPGGVVGFRRQIKKFFVSQKDDTPGGVVIPYFLYFVKRFSETFFKKFFKKVLHFISFFGIIKLQKMKEGMIKMTRNDIIDTIKFLGVCAIGFALCGIALNALDRHERNRALDRCYPNGIVERYTSQGDVYYVCDIEK